MTERSNLQVNHRMIYLENNADFRESFAMLPQTASAINFSAEKTQKILKQIPNRDAKLVTLTLLFSREPQVAQFIQNKYDSTPKEFSITMADSFRPLLDVLPSEYNIMPVLDCNKWKPLDELQIDFRILSQSTEKMFERLGNINLPFAEYLDNRTRFEQESGFQPAGDLEFKVFQSRKGEVIFDQLYGEYTHLLSQKELEVKKINQASLPVPLRHSDGQTLGISDAMKESQERLIGNLAEKSGHIGIIFSRPEGKAVNLLARRGYSKDVGKLIPDIYRAEFKKTLAYRDVAKLNGIAKFIYIPQA